VLEEEGFQLWKEENVKEFCEFEEEVVEIYKEEEVWELA